MALEKLKKTKPRDIVFADDLKVEWRDGLVSHFPFFALRDACPCAQCIDEMSGNKVLDPKNIRPDIRITNADYVGNYAIRISWSDGHDTGIYAFRFLREFFEIAQESGGFPGAPPHGEN